MASSLRLSPARGSVPITSAVSGGAIFRLLILRTPPSAALPPRAPRPPPGATDDDEEEDRALQPTSRCEPRFSAAQQRFAG